jgi:transposase InsO family protein
MPWLETAPVKQRERFIADVQAGLYSMTELCERYGISRTSGYKWVDRAEEGGRSALADRSRAPHHCPHRIPDAIAELLCTARRRHPQWGPKQLLALLRPRHRRITAWPAISTVGDLLVRHGLVTKCRRRRHPDHPGTVPPHTTEPNDIWAADFKGQFRTGDGIYCYPLTISDQHSRFLLTCHSLRNVQTVGAKPAFERAFREYGLPRAIRTDNGVPFATQAIHGLSQLNVWWIRLGIQHQRILPAHPQQNGAHERMHKTLKAGAIRPPRATLPAQQRAFDVFRTEYNEVRPHDTLHGRTPASVYRASPRPYPRRLPPIEYPGHYLVKRITSGGTFRFGRRLLFLATPLEGYDVGLDEVEDGVWSIYFCNVLIARFDERKYVIRS